MKYAMFVITVMLVACYGNAADYPLPNGYTESQMCRTDSDCKGENEICWFVGTGVRPTCIPEPYNYQWRAY